MTRSTSSIIDPVPVEQVFNPGDVQSGAPGELVTPVHSAW